MKENKVAEALIDYQAAVQLDDRDGRARLKLGRAFLRAGDTGKALDQLVRAADLLPKDVGAQLEAARALLTAGRFEDSRTRSEGVLRADPKNVNAHVLRAAAAAGLKDPEGAITTLEEALTLDKTRSDVYLNLATLRAAQGKPTEAEAGFKQAVAVDPRSSTAHLALANFYWVAGRLKEAEQALLNGGRTDGGSVRINRALANLYRSVGRAAEAEEPLKKIVAASQDPQPRLELADYYIAQERSAEARTILEGLAKRPEAAAAARARLAGIEYTIGNPAEAHRQLDTLIVEQPTNTQVRIVKGGWLLREKKLDEALLQAEAAVKADPRSAGRRRRTARLRTGRAPQRRGSGEGLHRGAAPEARRGPRPGGLGQSERGPWPV